MERIVVDKRTRLVVRAADERPATVSRLDEQADAAHEGVAIVAVGPQGRDAVLHQIVIGSL
jgi:hypothetical protein